jgi:hypothetical protein
LANSSDLSRRNVWKPIAAGLVAAAVIPSAANAAAPLLGLIEAHRAAHSAFCRAIDHENEMEEAYEAAFPQTIQVPSLIGGGLSMSNGYDECKKFIADSYQCQRDHLTPLSRIAPELAEQARAALDVKEVENMALIDEVFAEEETRKEVFGFAAAMRAKEEADDAEIEAAVALCVYPCKTIDEAAIKAKYLKSAPGFKDGLQPDHAEALLKSFC